MTTSVLAWQTPGLFHTQRVFLGSRLLFETPWSLSHWDLMKIAAIPQTYDLPLVPHICVSELGEHLFIMFQWCSTDYFNNCIWIHLKHERYMQGDGSFPNDVALVKLATAVDLRQESVDVIEMAATDEDFTGQTGILTGWGLTNTWGKLGEVWGQKQVDRAWVSNYTSQYSEGCNLFTQSLDSRSWPKTHHMSLTLLHIYSIYVYMYIHIYKLTSHCYRNHCQKWGYKTSFRMKVHDDAIEWKTFSALQAFGAGKSAVTGEFPSQRPVTQSFDIFFDLRLNQQLSKQ